MNEEHWEKIVKETLSLDPADCDPVVAKALREYHAVLQEIRMQKRAHLRLVRSLPHAPPAGGVTEEGGE